MKNRVKKECQFCHIKFSVQLNVHLKGSGKYCSRECQHNARSEYAAKKNQRICESCGTAFIVKTIKKAGRFCSTSCYHTHQKNNAKYMVTKKCRWCGNDYRKKRQPTGDNFCSEQCIKDEKESKIAKCLRCEKEFKRLPYLIKTGRGKYCSPECGFISRRTQVEIICRYCGEKFKVAPARLKNETGKYCSHTCCNLWKLKNEPAKVARGNWRGGVRNDLNLYMRSSWEANYARYLNYLKDYNKIKTWEYESEVFKFDKEGVGSKFYLPDFKIFNNDGAIEFHEVKGWMDDRSKMQLEKMKKYYPNVRLIVIDAKIYKCINRFFKSLPEWEKA